MRNKRKIQIYRTSSKLIKGHHQETEKDNWQNGRKFANDVQINGLILNVGFLQLSKKNNYQIGRGSEQTLL